MLLRIGFNGFRHAAHIVVLAQEIRINAGKRVYSNIVVRLQQVHQPLTADGAEELRKAKRIDVDKRHFPHRKRVIFVVNHPEKRTGGNNMQLRQLVMEILEREQPPAGKLYLIEEQKRFTRHHLLACQCLYAHQYPRNVKVSLKQRARLLLLLKIDFNEGLELRSAQFACQPCLACLTGTFQNEGLTP